MPQLALLLSSYCLSLRASAICFNDGAHISNYIVQRCSSTLTFINIPLVPPGATDFTPLPPPHPWKIYCCCCSRLQFSLKQNPLCSWLTRFRKKASVGGSPLPSPWRQSPSPTTVSSLGPSSTPSRERDIYDSDGSDG